MQIREDLKEQVVLVNVVGVVALLNRHEVILGLEVKMDAVNGWRKKYWLSPISAPEIKKVHNSKCGLFDKRGGGGPYFHFFPKCKCTL